MYYIQALGYDCCGNNEYKTLTEARKVMAEYVKDDMANAQHKLVKVRNDKDHIELKIGSAQSYHTYSEYWILSI